MKAKINAYQEKKRKKKERDMELTKIKDELRQNFQYSSLSAHYTFIKKIGSGGQGSCFLVEEKSTKN